MPTLETDVETAETITSAVEDANIILAAKHLHQTLWLPENAIHEKLRVTFSTTSNFDDAALPVILFCAPMFGSRYMIIELDYVAKKRGVRIIFTDRPGMGGSTPVALNIRVQVWLETVPALLKHLEVDHVNLMSHSAGTLYALNTMYHLRDILDPEAPYVALIAPWVHNSHSHATLMNLASRLPNSAFDSWSGLVKFINQKVTPAISWSGGALSWSASVFQTSRDDDESSAARFEQFGLPEEVTKALQKLEAKYIFLEDTTAGNEEARLCLKKGKPGSLGVCEDYEEFVRTMLALEQERRKSNPDLPKLKLQVFFAESDIMIGAQGQAYFDRIWMHEGVKESILYEGRELEGTNHETTITDLRKGALEAILKESKQGGHGHGAASSLPSN